MNGKSARFCRKMAMLLKKPKKEIYNYWNWLPAPERGAYKKRSDAKIAAHKEKLANATQEPVTSDSVG